VSPGRELRAQAIDLTAGGKTLLRGVDIDIRPGEIVGLLGPNGAGKSTLIRVLTGILRPTSGTVTLDGIPLTRLRRREIARRIAVAQQGGELPEGFTVQEVVSMGRAPHRRLLAAETAHDRRIVGEAMRETGVFELRSRRVALLSGGERQRVTLARALAQEAGYLLLDEPTAHLDLRFQLEAANQVKRLAAAGVGVLLVLHDLRLAARTCDRVVVLSGGEVHAHGEPAQVLTGDLIARVYGADAGAMWSEGG